MQFNVHTAKTQLSKLIEAALAGKEVIIAKAGQPVVQLVPVKKKKLVLGSLQHIGGDVPDFFEPMSEEGLALWEGSSDDDPGR